MPKWAKLVVGLLLLPLCAGGAQALWRVLVQTGEADTFWVAAVGGAACWWIIYVLLPKPMWVYVVGHELTHALWVWLFGGKVKKIKVTSKGGEVVSTKTNFLIALAPYFFPVYVVLVMLVFFVGQRLWPGPRHHLWFHFLIGAAYAFHVTLTWHILQTRQSDITGQGCVFSAVVIALGNLLVLIVGIPLLAGQPPLRDVFTLWLRCSGELLLGLAGLVQRLGGF